MIKVISASLILAPFIFGSVNQHAPVPKDELIVHEWGTFTTLHASNGDRLDGLYIEEEQLPEFVYETELPDDIEDQFIRRKGMYLEPQNVTVKMETPVLYFYTDKKRKVDIKVDFPRGTISQWYPQRTDGDKTEGRSEGGTIDFSEDYDGWIEWKNIEVLPIDDQSALSPDQAMLTPTWTAPREVKANNIRVNGEVEKYLFYRGLGNFEIPVEMEFIAKEELELKNTASDDIPYFFVYEIDTNGNSAVHWTGSIAKNDAISVDVSKPLGPTDYNQFKGFTAALVDAGLYQDEAIAMLKTWETSYFKTPGLRVFWILPREEVDRILPITIKPNPAKVERVFVGRCDIMTPKFEDELVERLAESRFQELRNHRYYLGYRKRMEELTVD